MQMLLLKAEMYIFTNIEDMYKQKRISIPIGEPEDVVEKAKQALHAQIASKQRGSQASDAAEEDETSIQEDAELENELEGLSLPIQSTSASIWNPPFNFLISCFFLLFHLSSFHTLTFYSVLHL